jgi:DNA-binding transcriptional regulator GbsR (MarR family)
MTLQQLRETTQQDSGTLSPYLKRMIAANILEKNAETSRNAVYSIKDSLFKLWLVKESNINPYITNKVI